MNSRIVTDPIFADFLRAQLAQAQALAAQSDIVDVIPLFGEPFFQFVVEFKCRGLTQDDKGAVVESDGPWAYGVNFPANYLRGGFGAPNVLAYIGPAPRPFHPNQRGKLICLEVRPAMPLTDIIYSLYELTTWSLVGTGDGGLNAEAAQWYRNQDPRRFPLDRRPLKRRAPDVTVKPADPKP